MAEVFAEFRTVVNGGDGRSYMPRAVGGPMDNVWQGWIEFVAADSGEVVRTPRETTQPNRTDIAYWASGLTPVYLEGALSRALNPRIEIRETVPVPAFDRPAPPAISVPGATSAGEGVLDPFSVYQKGERQLRNQLAALSPWHLVNIVRAHGFSDAGIETLNAMSPSALVELIVTKVKTSEGVSARR